MNDIDTLLSIIENPTRRRILESLVREPSYPLQLSKELGVSQQAVMKNLALMEQMGMVSSHLENSNMGPKRTLYVPETEFTLVVDMHNCMFSARLVSQGPYSREEARMDGVEEAAERVRELDRRLKELDSERAEVIQERNSIMEWFAGTVRASESDAQKAQMQRIWNDLTGAEASDDNGKEV